MDSKGTNHNENGHGTVEKNATNVEGTPKKLPYPKTVFLIIGNEFCERFAYYGMRAVLVLYMTRKMGMDDDRATVIYHVFTMGVYFMCVLGAIVSDVWLGKFKTIFLLSLVYAAGSALVSVGAIPYINLSLEVSLYVGLVLIALGSGGIKPCVSAFGGDQFKLPEQTAQAATFFSLFYFSINSGSLISMFVTPILREDVHCFGDQDCYSLAFGVPGVLMVLSILVFLIGKPFYRSVPPTGNMVVSVTKCISTAISVRSREKKTNPREHWLDYAEEKFGRQLVNDTKTLLKVLVLYLPLPFFWALYDQQGSRWTFQATRMDGDIGFYNMKPDQMQIVNPLLILTFIPLCEILLYPLLNKVGIRRPLQKLTVGGILAGISFLLSAFVSFELEKYDPVLPGVQEAQFRLFNGMPCTYSAVSDIPSAEKFTINALQVFEAKHISMDPQLPYGYTLTTTDSNAECPKEIEGSIRFKEAVATSVFLNNGKLESYTDNPDRSRTGDPMVRFLISTSKLRELLVRSSKGNRILLNSNTTNRELIEANSGAYNIYIDKKEVLTIQLPQGSSHTIIMREKADGSFDHGDVEIVQKNSLSMLWLVPQYVVLTLGEVMFSVTGLAFSYEQAPESMKSVLQACWLLTVAFGNVIIVIIAEVKIFKSQAYEFILFACLLFVDMLIFMILAYRYKSVKDESNKPISSIGTKEIDEKIDAHSAVTLPSAPVED